MPRLRKPKFKLVPTSKMFYSRLYMVWLLMCWQLFFVHTQNLMFLICVGGLTVVGIHLRFRIWTTRLTTEKVTPVSGPLTMADMTWW